MSDIMPIESLVAQGCCCGLGCENCPYTPAHQAGTEQIDQEWINFYHTHPGVTRDQYQASK